jgi:hypothetical protein
MRNEELAAALTELKTAGIADPIIAKTGSGHLQVRWQVGVALRCYTVASSGSDWRGPKNVRAEVRRMLRADGLLVAPEKADPAPNNPPRFDARAEIEGLKRRIAQLELRLNSEGGLS